jgi:1-acyl-sn-glycerol-3-phosphate acyltransferase
MNPVYFIGWASYRLLFRVYFRCRILHADRVPMTGPVILASNHASFLDPPFIGSSLNRPINYLARKSLFRFPGIGAILRAVNAVPVDRDGGGAAGLKAILDRLNAGGGIVLFPEGTRTLTGELQPARSGVGLTVIKSVAPVVPVRIFGSYEALGKNTRFPKPRPMRLTIVFGEPMKFEKLREEAATCAKSRLKEIYQEVADQIMAEISKLQPGRAG